MVPWIYAFFPPLDKRSIKLIPLGDIHKGCPAKIKIFRPPPPPLSVRGCPMSVIPLLDVRLLIGKCFKTWNIRAHTQIQTHVI